MDEEVYGSLKEFRASCKEFAKAKGIDLVGNWKQITSILWANHYRCTTQGEHPICPCPGALGMVEGDGHCSCELFWRKKDESLSESPKD